MNDFEFEILEQIKHYLDTMIHMYSVPRTYDKACQEYESQGMYIAFINMKCFIEFLQTFYDDYNHNNEVSHND